LVIFSADGHVVEVIRRESPVAAWTDPREYGEAAAELDAAVWQWWNEDLRLAPGVVWVREFSADELSVEVLPDSLREEAGNPAPALPIGTAGTDEEWRSRGGRVRSWLERRNFVIDWGNDYWADWRGVIHSS
jgi:hypothetical protein